MTPIPSNVPTQTTEMLSVRGAFADTTVLMTGATGFVGSLVLEQLLRICPELTRVYVLARPKKAQSTETRLQKLLDNGIFHLLWDKPDILKKVHVVSGDIGIDGLGLDQPDRERLLSEVHYVIHVAADVSLNDPIRETLNNNYCGTRRLLEFCAGMENIQAFCHVSTAYVNAPQKGGSTVVEAIYPLMHGDHVVHYEEIASELLDLSPSLAEDRASIYIHRFGFPNTYCFGKHLTEQLVDDWHGKRFPTCIIRPSLVGSVAGKPYPGYIGNLAGGGGYAISYAVGFFGSWAAAWVQSNVTDLIPVDVVTSVILTATAATHVLYGKEAKARIYHACSSTTYPITNHELCIFAKRLFAREPPPYCMLLGDYPEYPLDYVPNPWLLFLAKSITYCKVCIVTWMAKLMGKERLARRLEVGFKAWDVANTSTYDFNLFFSTQNVHQLNEKLMKEEQKDLMLLWTSQRMNWSAFFLLSLSGIKRLLLKTELKDPKQSPFRYIPPRTMRAASQFDKKQE